MRRSSWMTCSTGCWRATGGVTGDWAATGVVVLALASEVMGLWREIGLAGRCRKVRGLFCLYYIEKIMREAGQQRGRRRKKWGERLKGRFGCGMLGNFERH